MIQLNHNKRGCEINSLNECIPQAQLGNTTVLKSDQIQDRVTPEVIQGKPSSIQVNCRRKHKCVWRGGVEFILESGSLSIWTLCHLML